MEVLQRFKEAATSRLQPLTTPGPVFWNARMVQFHFTNKDPEPQRPLPRHALLLCGVWTCPARRPVQCPCLCSSAPLEKIFMDLIPYNQKGFLHWCLEGLHQLQAGSASEAGAAEQDRGIAGTPTPSAALGWGPFWRTRQGPRRICSSSA